MNKLALAFGIVALAALSGCTNNKSTGSAGAVKDKDCATSCADKAATCTDAKKADGNMGAVSEKKKSGCCSQGKKAAEGNMGAVAPKADCSSKAASTCPLKN